MAAEDYIDWFEWARYNSHEFLVEPVINDDVPERKYMATKNTKTRRIGMNADSIFAETFEQNEFDTKVEKFKRAIGFSQRLLLGMNKQRWVTSNNQTILVDRMSDKHLANTIKFLRKRARLTFGDNTRNVRELDTQIAFIVPTYSAMLAAADENGVDTFDLHLFGDQATVERTTVKSDWPAAQTYEENVKSLYKSAVTRVTSLEANVAEHERQLGHIRNGLINEILSIKARLEHLEELLAPVVELPKRQSNKRGKKRNTRITRVRL